MEGIKLNGIYLEIKAITEDVRFEVFIAINMKTVARYTSKNCMASHPVLIIKEFWVKQLKQNK